MRLILLTLFIIILCSAVKSELTKVECTETEGMYWHDDYDQCVCRRTVLSAGLLQIFYGVLGGGWWYIGETLRAIIITAITVIAIIFHCIGAGVGKKDGAICTVLGTLMILGAAIWAGFGFIKIMVNNEPISEGCYLE